MTKHYKNGHYYTPKNQPLPNEIPLKQWIYAEAEREHTTPHAIENRLWRGKYPNLPIRSLGRNTNFVRLEVSAAVQADLRPS